MRKSIYNKLYIGLSVILILFLSSIPLMLKIIENDDYLKLTLALMVFQSLIATGTLAVVLLLHERFSLDTQFIVKKAEKVFELIDFLKGRVFIFKADGFEYFVKPDKDFLIDLKNTPFYHKHKNNTVLIRYDDFDAFCMKILKIRSSYWLPEPIKEKMKFLEFVVLGPTSDEPDNDYVRLSYGYVVNENWLLPVPNITFDQFNNELFNLVQTIENWLEKNSNFSVKLNLIEPEYFKDEEA